MGCCFSAPHPKEPHSKEEEPSSETIPVSTNPAALHAPNGNLLAVEAYKNLMVLDVPAVEGNNAIETGASPFTQAGELSAISERRWGMAFTPSFPMP